MAQVINTNVTALFASAALNRSQQALSQAQQRLSSGVRINSASDDPTGLVTATAADSQVRGANQAVLNANSGITTAQTNDGYLSQVTSNLQRLREIAVQNGGSASGVEATALITENTRINGLVNAATSTVVNDANGGTFTTTGVKPTLASTATSTVAQFDTDIAAVSTARANYGADIASLSSAVATLQTYSVNKSATYSAIMDTNYATESSNMAKNNILQQAGMAALAQANQTPNSVLSLLR
jgi:flagellin